MAAKTFWMSYDLGIKGDYSGLYAWLDTVGARECGDSVAVFKMEVGSADPAEEILKQIRKFVEFGKTDRLYLIYRDESRKLNKGKFIVGNRKVRAPWEGYAIVSKEHQEDY